MREGGSYRVENGGEPVLVSRTKPAKQPAPRDPDGTRLDRPPAKAEAPKAKIRKPKEAGK